MPKMTFSKPRLICTDLDRTLLDPKGQVSSANRATLQAATTRGVVFAVASGRRLPSIEVLMAGMAISGYKIFFNGACIADPSGKLIHRQALAPSRVRKLIDLGAAAGVNVTLSTMTANVDYIPQTAQWVPTYIEAPATKSDLTPLYQAAEATEVFKVSYYGADLAALGAALATVSGRHLATGCWTDTRYVEMTAPGVDKFSGIRWLCRHLGLAVSQVAAFGDYDNDISMLAGVGCGVAMSNALPQVKQAAALVVDNHASSGVAKALLAMLK